MSHREIELDMGWRFVKCDKCFRYWAIEKQSRALYLWMPAGTDPATQKQYEPGWYRACCWGSSTKPNLPFPNDHDEQIPRVTPLSEGDLGELFCRKHRDVNRLEILVACGGFSTNSTQQGVMVIVEKRGCW